MLSLLLEETTADGPGWFHFSNSCLPSLPADSKCWKKIESVGQALFSGRVSVNLYSRYATANKNNKFADYCICQNVKAALALPLGYDVWLHLLICIISNRASDVTCMFWTRWLLITGSKWSYRSVEGEILIQCFVLTLHCQLGWRVVNSAKHIFRVKPSPQFLVCFLWHQNEQHDNPIWKHEMRCPSQHRFFWFNCLPA